MINIITGGRSSGKTETMNELCKTAEKPFGFIADKRFSEGYHAGYDILDLNTGKRSPFIKVKKAAVEVPAEYDENPRFIFDKNIYKYVYDGFKKELSQCSTLFLDEIGKLELEYKKGFYNSLMLMLENSEDREIYLSVSEKNLKSLLNIIEIKNKEYRIIRKVSLAAVIMASGSSSRFGKENKLLKKIDGKTFFTKTLETVLRSDVFSSVFVVTSYDEIIKEAENYWNITCIYNENADKGISESVKKGVKAADREGADGYMFIPCDQVFLSEKTLRNLADAFVKKSDNIAAYVFEGECVSPVIFPKRFRERILKLTGDTGGREIIFENRASITEIEINDGKEITDIDTQEDYNKWVSLKKINF